MEEELKIQPASGEPTEKESESKFMSLLNRYKVQILFFAGLAITFFLCCGCLFNNNCNPIVVGYLCFLSLACFLACGLPFDKILSILKSQILRGE